MTYGGDVCLKCGAPKQSGQKCFNCGETPPKNFVVPGTKSDSKSQENINKDMQPKKGDKDYRVVR